MPFRFACPECGIETLVEDEFAGQSGPCAGCGKVITIPYLSAKPVSRPDAPRKRRWLSILLLVVSGILAALFVFAFVVWLGFPVVRMATGSVQRMSCQRNLVRIAQALKQYEIDHGTLPCAYIPDAKGKPMHSWRVLILPQLGEQGLYSMYRFDEPWDGPNNSALIAQMPDVFACPADPDARLKGESSYMVIVGPNTAFPGAKAVSTRNIIDDHSLTILVAEVPVAGVAWTEPKDLDATRMKFAMNTGASGEVGSLHGGSRAGANIVTVNGGARFISELYPEQYLEAMTTIASGEDIPLESLD